MPLPPVLLPIPSKQRGRTEPPGATCLQCARLPPFARGCLQPHLHGAHSVQAQLLLHRDNTELRGTVHVPPQLRAHHPPQPGLAQRSAQQKETEPGLQAAQLLPALLNPGISAGPTQLVGFRATPREPNLDLHTTRLLPMRAAVPKAALTDLPACSSTGTAELVWGLVCQPARGDRAPRVTLQPPSTSASCSEAPSSSRH